MLSWSIIGILFTLIEMVGIATAIHAIWFARTSQGAIAWSLLLVMFPMVGLPAYWVLGRTKFHGYIEVMRKGRFAHHDLADEIFREVNEHAVDRAVALPSGMRVVEQLARLPYGRTLELDHFRLPFTEFNEGELLIDGAATFGSIFEAIEQAQHYILLEFFIVRDDELGRQLKKLLEDKAAEGVRVHFLFDEVGCHKLPATFMEELRAAGVEMRRFGTTRGRRNRFQLNFRNHRKITIVDGRVAYVGGLNVGDEYMGRSRKHGPWRDTHIRLTGPVVQSVQLIFLENWYWATRKVPDLEWDTQPSAKGQQRFLAVPTAPTTEVDGCALMFVHAINAAQERLWLASPYFVPSNSMVQALQLAALRGVDVRIMLPLRPDHIMVYLASFSYLAQLDLPGIEFYRYEPGFLHQKVMLIDDEVGVVGTANADNRSFRLNFEISIFGADRNFAAQVKEMLENDFAQCVHVTADDYKKRSVPFKIGVKLARLMSPIL